MSKELRPLHVAAHVFVLAGFAFAQPLYDLFARQLEFFVSHGAGLPEILLMTLLLSLVIPGCILAVIALTGRVLGKGAARALLYGVIVSLLAVILLPILHRLLAQPGVFLVACSLALGVAGTFVYARTQVGSLFCSALSPAALLFPLLFLFGSPVADLIWSSPAEEQRPLAIESTAPVILLVFDELPLFSLLDAAGEIDAVRYPGFAALARDSYWFPNATTVALTTNQAVPAILTGKIPHQYRAPILQQFPQNLFTLLGASGYRLKVFETVTELCPDTLCEKVDRGPFLDRASLMLSDVWIAYQHFLYPEDLAAGLPQIHGAWMGFAGNIGAERDDASGKKDGKPETEGPPARDRSIMKLLDSLEAGGDSTLYFAHGGLPHYPWMHLPSGKRYRVDAGPLYPHGFHPKANLWTGGDWAILQAYQRHLLQLSYGDQLLGRLLSRLKELGLYDDALIIVLADHGASFRRGESLRKFTRTNLSDLLNIPFFVKRPGQREGVVSDRNVETVDVVPTVLAELGVEPPTPLDGQSVLDFSLPERKEKWLCYGELRSGCKAVSLSVLSDVGERVAWKIRHFGARTGNDRIFRIGRFAGDLVGRRVEELQLAGNQPSGVVIQLDHPEQYRNSDPEASLVPVHIMGRLLRVPGGEHLDLAIAINGTIEAVTHTYIDAYTYGKQGEMRFTAMIPEKAIVGSATAVDIFVIRGSPGAAVLERAQIPAKKRKRKKKKLS
jgi:hypothetical protein